MTAVRVLTVDDQDVFLRVAADVIEATPGFEAVGQAASGAEALEAVRRLDPQLVLLDVHMPGLDGVAVAHSLASTHPDTVVVLISVAERDELPQAALTMDVPVVRKRDFGPRLLRRLWSDHGRR